MQTNIQIKVEPFPVPHNVMAKVGKAFDPFGPQEYEEIVLPLSALDPLALDKLCRDFRASVFSLAGKEQPPEKA